MTTQDKPAVGPLSAGDVPLLVKGDLLRCDRWNGEMFTAGREYAVVSINADGDPVLVSDEGESVPPYLIDQFTFVRRPAPTASVEAGGSERWTDVVTPELLTDDELNAVWKAPGGQGEFRREWDDKPHRLIYRLLGHIASLRPQPSGKTLQSLAQAFEDAMEGSHGAWAVSGDGGQAGDSDAAKLLAYEDAHQVALELGYPSLTEALEHLADLNPPPSGETREAVAARIRRLVSLADADFSFVAREAYVSKETDAILALLRPAAPSDSEMRDAISLILPLAKGYAAAHPVGSNQAYVDYVESLVSNEGDDVIRPVEPEEIKAAYQRGWNDREADIIERTERIALQPDALAVLDRLLAYSGARGTFDAMKHGDAVKEAEALLQARRDEPGVSSWPEVTDAWAETYCALTGKDPDGQQVTFVDGATVTTFRDMAKREIEAMLCAAPKAAVRAIAALTPPAEPVSRPAGEGETTQHTPRCWGRTSYSDEMAHCYCKPAGEGEGEREAVLRRLAEKAEAYRGNAKASVDTADLRMVLSLLRPAAPDGGGLADLAARVTAEVKRGADGSHVQALGALSNIEAMVRSAIPARKGARDDLR